MKADGRGASTGPGLPATRSAKMVRCRGPRIRTLGPLSEEQVAELQKRLLDAGWNAVQTAAFPRAFGVETLTDLPAAKFEQAVEWIDDYRRRHAGGYSREELDRARDKQERAFPALRRMRQHREAGMDFDEAWDLGLAEELAERRSWSLWLLKRVAERFLEYHKPRQRQRINGEAIFVTVPLYNAVLTKNFARYKNGIVCEALASKAIAFR